MRLINGDIRELAWIMFRESAKTSIAKAYVVYLVCTKKRRYINVDSFDKTNAESALFDITKSLMTNKMLIADFGQLFTRTRNQNEMTLQRIGKFLTRNGVVVEARSTSESEAVFIGTAVRTSICWTTSKRTRRRIRKRTSSRCRSTSMSWPPRSHPMAWCCTSATTSPNLGW